MSMTKIFFNTKQSLKTLISKVFRPTKTLKEKREKLIESPILEEDTSLITEKKEKESNPYLKTPKQQSFYKKWKNKMKKKRPKTDIKRPRIKKSQEGNYLYCW